MSDNKISALIVTGAGGHLGRRVVELLLEGGAGPIIATTRDPAKLADLAARGVTVRRADFDDPATLADAFAGGGRLLLISTDALDRPGRRLAQHRAAVAAAQAAGVGHVVYTSVTAAHPTPESSLSDDHFWTEQALAASPMGWTILRNNLYTDLLLMALPHAVATGQHFTATGSGGRGYVTREDCARAAAGALRHGTGRQIFDVTGPAPVTQDQVAAIASDITGRPVAHVALTADALRPGLTAAGLPPFMVDVLIDFDIETAQGYYAIATSTVQDLGGRAPTSVADFLRANSAALLGGH